jgi:hypothetical protein
MNCDCTEKISALIDGELSREESQQLERHLLNCVECQDAKTDFLNLRSQITDFPVAFKPAAQRAALTRILGGEKSPTRSTWRWAFNPAVATVASLLIVGAVIALLVYPRLKSNPVTQEIAKVDTRKNNQRPAGPASAGDNRQPNNPKGAVPKKSQPPSSDRNKAPNKKRAPLMFEPQQDNIAEKLPAIHDNNGPTRSADAETMTAIHFQKSELLLRSFRNVRLNKSGSSPELGYEKKLAQQLVYQNMMLRREADTAGDTQVASLLESLEPILLDIANLPAKPQRDDVRVIKDRVERKNIVALLQVNSTALARALD